MTVATEALEAAIAKVQAGQAPSLSAYVSEALAEKVARDERRDGFLEWLRELDEEPGPPSAEAEAWARESLGL